MKKIVKIKNKIATMTLIMSLLTLSVWTINTSVYAEKEIPKEKTVEMPKKVRRVGYTIAQTFPDPNMAQAVADVLSGGNVNHQLIPTDIDYTGTFNFRDKNITDISGIEYFTKLRVLRLDNNQLTSLPENIDSMTSLLTLDVTNNQLTSLPNSIGNLPSLKQLIVGYNQLTSLPNSIDNLTNLDDLQFSHNKLVSLPESIVNLTNLKSLHLDNNNITSLPAGIGNLALLRSLTVNNNRLTSLPESIGYLTSLRQLYAYGNEITRLPESIGILISLEVLDLNDNQLTSLPESIGNLSNIHYLTFENNQLTSLPDSIGNLTTLRVLLAPNNQLTSLPESIGNLVNLSGLNLSENKLTILPDSIGNLTMLYDLYLDLNQLTSLPESIGNLTNLSYYRLGDNLLPTDYHVKLNELGVSGGNVSYETQDQLSIQSPPTFDIRNQNDLDSINYNSFLHLDSRVELSSNHKYILENYVDENNQPVNIQDYILNGVIIKSGVVFAQVRATGTGLFPNNSDHALTSNYIKLKFKMLETSTGGGNSNVLPKTGLSSDANVGLSIIAFGLMLYVFKKKNNIE